MPKYFEASIMQGKESRCECPYSVVAITLLSPTQGHKNKNFFSKLFVALAFVGARLLLNLDVLG